MVSVIKVSGQESFMKSIKLNKTIKSENGEFSSKN